MEISEVRKRVVQTIERAKRAAAERRARTNEAARAYEEFLEGVAVPLFRQIANVLRAEGYLFSVSTPGGSVRLTSDRTAEDYLELALDTARNEPTVIGHSSRRWGRRVVESERPVADGAVRDLTEEDLLRFVLAELERFVER
jgi:hypothetical protein